MKDNALDKWLYNSVWNVKIPGRFVGTESD